MSNNRIWVLGADDPEMGSIEALLKERDETVLFAEVGGQRVHPGNAYSAAENIGQALYYVSPFSWGDCVNNSVALPGLDVYVVELPRPVVPPELFGYGGFAGPTVQCTTIDHHRDGDPGFGRPPSEFLPASSLGQVIAELARLELLPYDWETVGGSIGELGKMEHLDDDAIEPGWYVQSYDGACDADVLYRVPDNLVLDAAADHCLGAAYRGACPGFAPDALSAHRDYLHARMQGVSPTVIRARILDTQAALASAPVVELAPCRDWRCACDDLPVTVRDMRRAEPWPELPEAATRAGVGYMAGPLIGPDGRRKFTCSGTTAQVEAWLEWAPRNGICNTYGDPARGFAGGYEA